MANLCESAELFLLFVSSAFSVKSRGYFGEAAEKCTRAACAPQIRPIRVIRGCLLFPQLVSIRVDSWLASQKRRQVAALQSASRAIGAIRVIGGSLENRKKFSLNPVEGISTSASMCTSNRVTADIRMHRLRKNK